MDICIASVEDYFAHTGFYLVRKPSGGTAMPAMDVSLSSRMPLGARSLQSYPPKTQVVILELGAMKYILGAVQSNAGDQRTLLPSSLTTRGRAGFVEDGAHNQPYSDPDQGLGNFSGGRPIDTIAGDWGHINDFGLAFYLGRLIASMRASDAAKIEAFYGDDLVRLTGYNLEVFTACSERQDFNDEGEAHCVFRATPFPWEALGMKSPEMAAKESKAHLDVGCEEAPYEPKEKDQMMLAREHTFRGYLGDLRKRLISLPPKDLTMERYSLPSIHNGVLEITENINGAYAIRSAKEIHFEKYVLLPVPKQLIQPDDPKGDTSDDYAAAGQIGNGDKPELKEFEWGDTSAGVKASQLYDMSAWLFNRYSTPGLGAHKKDWKYPEESELKDLGTTAVYDKPLRQGHKFALDLPSFEEVDIDERPGHKVKYYKSRSGIHQMDDGSIIIEDGWGSQLIMSGGNIYFTCVGDVWSMPGRNAITWAPHDVIQRAGNSADITAAKGDVRFKAEHNMHLLAGNAGNYGGLLLESRAKGTNTPDGFKEVGEKVRSYGVIVKAADSEFNVMAKDMYIGRGQKEAGKIVIDAGKQGYLLVLGEQIINKATDLYCISLQRESDADAQSLAMTSQGAIMTVPVQMRGDLTLVEGENSGGNLLVGGAAIVYGGVAVAGGAVGDSKEIKERNPAETISQTIKDQGEKINEQLDDLKKAVTDNPETSSGNDDFQKKIGFSCRDSENDYKIDDTFILYEARWQQILRIKGQLGTAWDEPDVKAPNGEITLPHPGRAGWKEMSAFATIELKNFDMSAGRSKDRAALVNEGAAPVPQPLLGSYPINTQT